MIMGILIDLSVLIDDECGRINLAAKIGSREEDRL